MGVYGPGLPSIVYALAMSEKPFWTPARRRFWTIGAILILLTAAGVLTAYLVASKPEGLPREAGKGELAAFLSDEHKAAFREGTNFSQKFPVTDSAGLADGLRDWVGNAMTFDHLFPGGGVKLLGAGRSAVPGFGVSAHLRLEGSASPSQLSLFIKQYRQMPVLDDLTAYSLPGRGLGDGGILVWRRGGQIYYLVSNSQAGLGVLRQALGAPEPKKPY